MSLFDFREGLHMMRSRWQSWLWVALAGITGFFILRHLFFFVAVDGTRTDLDILLLAARRFMTGEPVYRLEDAFEHTKPPLLMALLFPLAWIPRFPVRLIWDLVIFIMPVLIWRESLVPPQREGGLGHTWKTAALVGALLYPFWFREAGYGQYNLVIFWFILLADRWIRSDHLTLQMTSGALAALTVVMKPTQIYLFPWLILGTLALSQGVRRGLRFAGGASLLIIALSLGYIALRSPAALITDHLEWLKFIRHSTGKHLLGTNNYGLPTLLTRLGWGDWASNPLFLPMTLLLTFGVIGIIRRRRELALNLSLLLMMAFSPMAWKANFGIFIGLASRLAVTVERRWNSGRAWIGVLAIFLVSRASEYWIGVHAMQVFGVVAAPLGLFALAIFCAFSREIDPEQGQ